MKYVKSFAVQKISHAFHLHTQACVNTPGSFHRLRYGVFYLKSKRIEAEDLCFFSMWLFERSHQLLVGVLSALTQHRLSFQEVCLELMPKWELAMFGWEN